MKGTWEKAKPSILTVEDGQPTVTKAALQALPWVIRCKLAYDPETPAAVVMALKYDFDASVSRCAFQREDVLAGRLLNPFEVGA
jgi:hypothetical protein